MRNKIRSVFSKARRESTLRGFLLFMLILSLAGGGRAENLLKNGSFEETDSEGHPVGWFEDAYNREEGYTVFSITEENPEDGRRAASIRNIGENDARYAQKVEVEPESLYRFSGYIKAEGIETGRGANLSIEGLYIFSESLYDTGGEWQYLEWYGETGENQRSVTLFARIGGYSGESTGQAWFDNLRLEEVEGVPGDGIADLWYKEERKISVYGDDDEAEDESDASPAWPRLILIAAGYTLAAVLTMLHIRKREKAGEKTRFTTPAFLGGLGAAMIARMVISYFVTGYMVDVNCFSSWGSTMANVGPAMFYPASGFCDYPPAYTYILGLNTLITRMIPGISEGMTRVIFRFLPGMCDILACAALDRFLRKEKPEISEGARRAALTLLAFHPVTILNSAAWCQMDSALALLILMVAIWAIEGQWQKALPCYMLAVLVKPQALMLGFLGLGAMIPAWRDQPEQRKRISTGIGAALAVAVIIVVPFSLHQDPLWIFRQYGETLASYPYATVNTANFYYLFDGNWDGIANPSSALACAALAMMSAGYGAAFLTRGKRAGDAKGWQRRWIEAGISGVFAIWFAGCAVFRAPWNLTGTGAMAFAFVIVMSLYLRKNDIRFLPYVGGLLFLLLYVFGVKMHERYLFPAFFLMALAYGLTREKRILTVMLGMTATMFLNEGIVLDNSIRLGSAMGHLNEDTRTLAMIISAINCGIAIYGTWTGLELAIPGESGERPMRRLIRDNSSADNRLHWNRKDTILMTAILAVYSVVTFSTLGSTKAPQHAWTSSDYDEQIILDLGENQENFTMLYFARVSRYDFSVATSRDGEAWEDETWAQMDQGQCWKWKYVTESTASDSGKRAYGNARHWFSGRYVRITAHQINLALCEVILRDENGKNLPIAGVERKGGDASSPLYSEAGAVIDEQDTMEGLPTWFPTAATGSGDETDPAVAQPGWWNSTYFDEIYHARTAWEFLTASAPYETSHPPLGKIIMSWGVALFGMTPFGWRAAGAAAGILMLAGVWLVAKQMTKSTACSAFACGMMALDCMHLTQTQIATIDSYPVLFILFAFFFMLRFLQTDWRTEKTGRVLTDLGASGLFMGLAIASKWIGIYAGAGLAVLFFWHGGRMLAADRKERKSLRAEGRTKELAERPEAWRKFLRICAFCVGAFVVIPAAIYLASYVPYFAYRRFTSLKEYLDAVAGAQTGMFNYHATPGLGMDHPFYSPWYEWPVMGKPMFYASKMYVFDETLSYSIFCFGNPALWFPAIATMIGCAWMWIRNREESIENGTGNFSSSPAGLDTSLVFLLIGFLAQYLPWMMVPRGTYIYHYFASVPFLVFSMTTVMEQIRRRRPRAGKWAIIGYLALTAAVFGVFFPYVTGIFAPKGWLDIGKIFLKIYY